MTYRVTKLKDEKIMFNLLGVPTTVPAGTRVLVEMDREHDIGCCLSWCEMTADQVHQEFNDNEEFTWLESVITEKGNRVDIYRDLETTDTYFKVTKLVD